MARHVEAVSAAGRINSGFAMLERCLDLLEEIAQGVDSLVRVNVARTRNAIGAGAVPYTISGIGVVASSAAGQSVPANPKRRGLIVTNTSATQNITIGLGISAPAAGVGLVLAPGGQWLGLVGKMLWDGSLSFVSSAAGGSVGIIEA